MLNNALIQEINRYDVKSLDDVKNAFREIGQKIILSGLTRGKIFDHVAFYGGTSLRLLYNLDRFSEDLDFTLIHKIDDFKLEDYLMYAVNELNSYGLNSSMSVKEKNINTSVITGYIKFNLQDAINLCFEKNEYKVNKEENISIKVEVETKFYEGYNLEFKTILFPSYFKVKTFDISTLFSCKLLAVLKRNWKTRVKGRDFFDFLFYVTNQVTPNYIFLANGLGLDSINKEELQNLLIIKFNETDFDLALKDVYPFIKSNSRFISLFQRDIFIDIVNEMK